VLIAAAQVNLRYLLILVVPSLLVIAAMAYTWYSRSRRQGGGQSRQPGRTTESRPASRQRSGGKRKRRS
jgi:hypothetical protein